MKKHMYPCLWFNNNAKEAADFYCSIFPDSKIINNSDVVVNFELNGQHFMGLNGANDLKFTEAVSFVIPCSNQEEIDYYWNSFTSNGGKEQQCGWCVDKFGLSWQVVPVLLNELMSDPEKAARVMQAFMKMKKLDIETLQKA